MSLAGKKSLIVGVANEHSIAFGCAEVFHGAGAELALTYLNAKAEPYVRPLAEKLQSPIIAPCDVREPGQTPATTFWVERHSRRQARVGRPDARSTAGTHSLPMEQSALPVLQT
jgi:enoyl-[acyl-carrier-protein] reductase (NADH)